MSQYSANPSAEMKNCIGRVADSNGSERVWMDPDDKRDAARH
jgi:hypothetical protein